MELFGIILSMPMSFINISLIKHIYLLYVILVAMPISFVAGSVYCVIIKRLTIKWKFLINPILLISALILSLVLLDFLGVAIFGVIKLQEITGQSYLPIHAFLPSLALPSLVNVMSLQKKINFLSMWYVIGIACALFGLGFVLLGYYISESLYGINGTVSHV